MNWLKALGLLVPLGIALSALGALAGLGSGLSAPPESVGVTPAAATLAFVALVLLGVVAFGRRSRRWVSRQYW